MPVALVLAAALALFSFNVAADDLDDAVAVDAPMSVGDVCPNAPSLVPVADEQASVGVMKNLAEHPESMRAVAGRLLKEAVENPEFLAPSACTDGCSENVLSEIVYEVQPIAFLAEDKQEQVCLNFEKTTKENPMSFGPHEFSSVDGLHKWINDFSRGKGNDGKKLYDQCSANCSPRYQFFITKNGEQFRLKSDVLCGLARDKDEENYNVTTKIRHTCRPK